MCIKPNYIVTVMINDNRIQNDHCLITTLARRSFKLIKHPKQITPTC